jgi:ketosteroid isomerase-like protein
MPEQIVEVVRAMFETWRERRIDAVFDLLAPGIEWEVRPDLPDSEVYKGHEGYRRLVARFAEVVEEMWYLPEEFIPVGEDKVVVPLRWGGRGKGSGVDFEERRETWIFTVCGGKIARVREFASREQALAAAGEGTATLPPAESQAPGERGEG